MCVCGYQDMFLAVVTVVDRLVVVPEQAVLIGHMTPAVKQMEAVAQILLRKVDTESKYLARLEGKASTNRCMWDVKTHTLYAYTQAIHKRLLQCMLLSLLLLTCHGYRLQQLYSCMNWQKQLESVATGQKGSDVSAREATRKLVAATKQMHALNAILQDVHASEVGPQHASEATDRKLQSSDENAISAAAAAGPWAAKNTIVRDVLHELTNAAQKSRTKHRYNVHQTSAGQLLTSASPAKPKL